MSTVSVVIPAYNAEPFIRAAIDSVLAQSVPAHEILVIDDGSQDNTPAIVDTYGGIVRLVRQANGGPSRARNHGTSLVTGEFVAFLDADDGWREDKLALQLAAVGAKPEAVLCYTGLEVLLPEGGMKIDRAWPEDQVVSTLRVFNPGIGPSSVMIRRQSFLDVNGFDERLKTCEDWDLWVRLSRKGPFCSVDQPVTIYRSSSTGLSADADRVFNDFELLLDRLLLDDLHGIPRAVWRRRILSYQSYKAALTARGAGEHEKERRYFSRSVLLWPSPFWYPLRFKAMFVTMMRTLGSKKRAS